MPAPHLGQLLWPIVKIGRWCLDRVVDSLRFEWFDFVLGRLVGVDDACFGGRRVRGWVGLFQLLGWSGKSFCDDRS